VAAAAPPRYSHCPVCGGRLAPPPEGGPLGPDDLRVCSSCGHELWLNSKPCVSALIVRAEGPRQYILLTRRGIEPYRGRWDVPGGYLRNGEPPEAGLARELAEELSAPLLGPRLAAIEIDEYLREDVPREARFTFNVFYLCTLPPDAELKPADDVTEARWFLLSEVPPDLAFASNRRALARLRNRIGEYLSEIRG
jgi:ADP-ribose pyrophosphatase YjhB (NUDIX family)